jgi:hypothetical protein
MEPRFGHDFSHVRVHTDERADESAREVNAIAYTVGRNIIFGQGRYGPASTEGRRLLAHELTHVIQQRGVESLSSEPKEAKQDTDLTAYRPATKVTNFGFRGIQRQAAKSEQAQTAQTDNSLLAQALLGLNQNTLALDDEEKWAVLASHAEFIPKSYIVNIHSYFNNKIQAGLITFENITENQRKVFSVMSTSQKEELRKAALLKSNLFQVVTKIQMNVGESAKSTQEFAAARLTDEKPELGQASLAWDFIIPYVVADMLIEEVTDAPVTNEPLAQQVRQLKKMNKADSGKQALLDKIMPLACGIGNLFALATARGSAEPTKGGAKNYEPTREAAKKWLKENILDQPPAKALLQISGGRFTLQTDPLLTGLSCTGRKPKYAAEPKPMQLTNEGSPALFQKSLEKSAGQLNTRLGIVQGKGDKSAHMYIVYRDMDGVWYTMDIYPNLADQPGGGLPNQPEYTTTKLWHKLIVD